MFGNKKLYNIFILFLFLFSLFSICVYSAEVNPQTGGVSNEDIMRKIDESNRAMRDVIIQKIESKGSEIMKNDDTNMGLIDAFFQKFRRQSALLVLGVVLFGQVIFSLLIYRFEHRYNLKDLIDKFNHNMENLNTINTLKVDEINKNLIQMNENNTLIITELAKLKTEVHNLKNGNGKKEEVVSKSIFSFFRKKPEEKPVVKQEMPKPPEPYKPIVPNGRTENDILKKVIEEKKVDKEIVVQQDNYINKKEEHILANTKEVVKDLKKKYVIDTSKLNMDCIDVNAFNHDNVRFE